MNKARWMLVAAVFSVTIVAFIVYRATAAKGRAASNNESVANSGNGGSGWHAAAPSVPIEISQRGPGMRPETMQSLKLSAPATLELTHLNAGNFATALGNDPTRIFNFVRDAIAYDPYVGCLRGVRGTLLALAGNSVDRAVLLSALLKASGQKVRFARGTLSEQTAKELVTSVWAPRPLRIRKRIQTDAVLNESLRTLTDSVEHNYQLIQEHLKSLPGLGSDPATPLSRLVADAQRHYWVQRWNGNSWMDLDPSFADSTAGTVYTAPEETFDSLPDSIFHHVVVRIQVEEYSSSSNGSELSPSQRDILTYTTTAERLSARHLVLTHQPENWNGPAPTLQAAMASAIGDTGKIRPVLSLDEDKPLMGEPFAQTPPPSGGLGAIGGLLGGFGAIGTRSAGPPLATAEYLEFEFQSPGGSNTKVEREIFDLVGQAKRAQHKLLKADEVRSKAQSDNILDLKRSVYDLFFTTGRVSRAAFETAAINQDSVEPEESDVAILEHTNLAFAILSDQIVQRLGKPERDSVVFYPTSPRVQITELTAQGAKGRASIDLRSWSSRAVTTGGSLHDVFKARIFRGVVNGVLERTIMEYVSGNQEKGGNAAISTSWLFERAAAEKIHLLLLPADSASLQADEDTKDRIDQELARHMLVLTPQRAIMLAGRPRLAWWRIDPRSGDSTAVTDEGLHQTSLEYRIVENRNSRGGTVVVREYFNNIFLDQTQRTFTNPAALCDYIDQLLEDGGRLVEVFSR